jgi:hypothetical protein
MHGSLECTPWTAWQNMCLHRYGPEYAERLAEARRKSRGMLASFIVVAELALSKGGEVSFEWPKSCSGWLLPELIAFIVHNNLLNAVVDGCSLGIKTAKDEPALKRWRFVTSCKRTAEVLNTFRCPHPKGFAHGELCGKAATDSAYYPLRMCRALLASLFGWYEMTPAMTLVPVATTAPAIASVPLELTAGSVSESKTAEVCPVTAHREREQGHRNAPIESLCAPPDCSDDCGVEIRVPLAVTLALDYNETRRNPRAIQAVQAEMDALAKCGTWDLKTLASREDVVAWAIKNKITIHIGEGLGICGIKNSEMPESQQKWKGRFCYRAPTARDEGGAFAIFQEMSSRPTTIVAVNVSIAYGCFPGNKTTAADAVRAYVQSDLKSLHPTWIEFPKHLCPPAMRHIHRPCCRLIKALYGHPEAGGHWERHLAAIVRELGGVPVPNHPSCFWFGKPKYLLLTIYVDDLLLSGPEGAHAPFWKALGAKVTIEDPEPLDRFLGRHHTTVPHTSTPEDLLVWFRSPVPV